MSQPSTNFQNITDVLAALSPDAEKFLTHTQPCNIRRTSFDELMELDIADEMVDLEIDAEIVTTQQTPPATAIRQSTGMVQPNATYVLQRIARDTFSMKLTDEIIPYDWRSRQDEDNTILKHDQLWNSSSGTMVAASPSNLKANHDWHQHQADGSKSRTPLAEC